MAIRDHYDDEFESFRDLIIERLSPRIFELLVCSYLKLPGHLKGRALSEAAVAEVGDRDAARKIKIRLEESSRELVRGITSATNKTRLMQGQLRLLTSICAVFENPVPEWLLDPSLLVPRRMVAAIRQQTPKHLLNPETDEYLGLIARLFAEVIYAMPKFERRAVKASALKLHHFVPDIEYIVETAVAVERRQEEEADYCHAMLRQLDYVELFGADIALESKRHSLSVAYVSLSLTQARGSGEEYLRPMLLEDLLETLQPHQSRMLIRGNAGSGKSTLFRWITLQAIRWESPIAEARTHTSTGESKAPENWRARIPILIRLRDCPDGRLPSPLELIAMISKGAGEPSQHWVTSILSEGRVILLFDGVDEIPHGRREEVREAIGTIIQEFPRNSFLISSRPEAIPRKWLDSLGFREAHVNPLSDTDKVEFIRKWHRAVELELQRQGRSDYELEGLCSELIARLPENPAVNRLAYNPLLCAMICALHRDRGKRLPQSQSDLCESLCQMLLERREIESGLNLSGFPACYLKLSYAHKRALVQELAHYLVRNGTSAIEADTAAERVQVVLTRFGWSLADSQRDASLVLKVLVERSGILREQRPDIIDFVHNTLKEYLAAERFVQDHDYGILSQHCFDSAWTPVLLFSVAHPNAKFATKLIDSVLQVAGAEEIEAECEELARTRKLMALRLRASATELEPRMHEWVNRLAYDLFPPQTLDAAEVYAGIGNIAVSFLHYKKSLSPGESAACVRTLRLIGTTEARIVLLEYREDSRLEVVSELLQALSVFEIPSLRNHLLAGEPLPSDLAAQVGSIDGIAESLGSATSLDLSGTRIKDLGPLNAMKDLRRLRMGSMSLSLSDLHAKSLDYLEIEDSDVLQASSIARMPKLKTVCIKRSRISGLERLESSPSIESLDLSGSRWTSGDEFLGKMANLVSLDMSGSSVGDLSVLMPLKKLSKLNLSNTKIRSIADLVNMKSLSFLDVQGTDVDPEDLSHLQGLLPAIKILRPMAKMFDINEVAGRVSVVIVTVREDEFTAVCYAFQARVSITGGRNIYRFASVETPDGAVGVAICRCSEQGNAKAQSVTGHAMDDFSPTPAWVMLVGIAGGFPDQDFTLGDVIVANRLHDFSVTASLSKGPNESYGRGGPMDRDVEALLGWLPTLHEVVDWRCDRVALRARPHEVVERRPRKTDYYGPKDWQARVHASLLAQLGDGSERMLPKLWIAPNLSGNVLLKNASLARQWKLFARSAASVEMEMAGAYEAVHDRRNTSRLVGIRGVSDIVGYKRSADWLEYACRTSASVAFALVSCGILHRIVRARTL